MRIDANTRVGAPAVKRTDSAGSGGGGFARALDPEAPPAAPEVAGAGIVEGLLAFQEVADPTAGLRRQAWRRGQQLLDRLDELRLGILEGAYSSERLTALAHLARSGRGATQDPRLDDILAEIELRAAVELAKLQRAL